MTATLPRVWCRMIAPPAKRLCAAAAVLLAVLCTPSPSASIDLVDAITAPVPAPNARFGRAIASADFDGDGIDDLAVSSGPTTGLGGYIGSVDVFFTAGAGSITLTSAQSQNAPSFGQSLAAGDINNDGRADLLVGSPNASAGATTGAGEVAVYFGPSLTQQTILHDPQPQAGAQFGISLVAGDLNADGFDEVVVGAWDSNVGPFNRAGEAFVFTAPALTQVRTFQSPEPQTVGDFGVAVGIGDIDGDDAADLVVGSWVADLVPNADEGKVFLFRGPALTQHVRLMHAGAGIRLGRSLAVADVSGDGNDDIVAGAHDGIVVFSEQLDGSFAASPVPLTDGGADVDARDANSDGFADILVGAPQNDVEGTDAGAAWLLLGPNLVPAHPLVDPQPAASDLLGTAVAVSDHPLGVTRMLISASGKDVEHANMGVVWAAPVDDADHDGVLGPDDNCPTGANHDQRNTDADPLDNGPLVAGDDVTRVTGDTAGDVCDADADNDGISTTAETAFPVAGCPSASGALDPLRMDTDGDHLHDGWECANGSDPANPASKVFGSGTVDADSDRIPDLWERRGYNASGTSTDSDTDGCHDLVETASVDANTAVTDADRIAVARRALGIWAPQADQDYVLDLNRNGAVEDADRIFVARAALLPTWQPKVCP